MVEVLREVGFDVVYHRVACHLVTVVAHLHVVDRNQIVRIGIVVSSVGLQQIVLVDSVAASEELAYIVVCIEGAVVGVHRSVAVDDLYQIGVDRGTVQVAVVLGTVAVYVGGVLVYEYVAEALEALVAVTHGAVGQNDRTVVVRGEVAHEDEDRRIAVIDHVGVVGDHVDHLLLLRFRRGLAGRRRASCQRRHRGMLRPRTAARPESTICAR